MTIEIEVGRTGFPVAKRAGHHEWETCGSTNQEAIGELVLKHQNLWDIKVTGLEIAGETLLTRRYGPDDLTSGTQGMN